MLVDNALRIAGRAAGVAEAAGITLVAVHPAIVAVLDADPVVELVLEAYIMFDGRPSWLQTLDDRLKSLVVKKDTVLGVVADIK
jgi:hypothetical protein